METYLTMGKKDAHQDVYNRAHGASTKRKCACKSAKCISAVALSKRPKPEKARSDQVNSGLSASCCLIASKEEAKCFEKVSSEVVKSFSRFLFYEKGEWLDFSVDATAVLFESLRSGKTVADVFVCGCMYLVNFVLMFQTFTETGYRRSIAWIDENGKCFFPPSPFDCWSEKPNRGASENYTCRFEGSEGLQSSSGVNLKTLMSRNWLESGYEATHDKSAESLPQLICPQSPQSNEEGESDSESTVTCQFTELKNFLGEAKGSLTSSEACTYPGLGDKLVQLDEADERFTLIKSKFLEGLGILQKGASVKSVYIDSHSHPFSQARLISFHRQLEVTKQTRGDPNLHYAWHGTSKEGVCGIVLHGFGKAMKPIDGAAFGIGVYLAPEYCSYVSAIYSDNDENSEQHVVLCKVIMGNTELVQHGSEQYHPSSEEFDTGVDNMQKPKRYVVWSTHMNTHILPLYVVNFKLSPEWHGLLLALRGKNTILTRSVDANHIDCDQFFSQSQRGLPSDLKPPSISFPLLLSILKSTLPEMNVLFLQRQYLCFKAKRISKLQLLTTFRRLVGDEKLWHAIMFMKKQALR